MKMYIIKNGDINKENIIDFIEEDGELCAVTEDRNIFTCNLNAFYNKKEAEKEMRSRFAMCG